MGKTRKQHRDEAAKQWFFNKCIFYAELRRRAKEERKKKGVL